MTRCPHNDDAIRGLKFEAIPPGQVWLHETSSQRTVTSTSGSERDTLGAQCIRVIEAQVVKARGLQTHSDAEIKLGSASRSSAAAQ